MLACIACLQVASSLHGQQQQQPALVLLALARKDPEHPGRQQLLEPAASTATTRYWAQKLPSTRMPAYLAHRLSPLSGAEVTQFRSAARSGQLGRDPAAASALCSAAHLMCALGPDAPHTGAGSSAEPASDSVLHPKVAMVDRGSHFYYYQNALLETLHRQVERAGVPAWSAGAGGAAGGGKGRDFSWFTERELFAGLTTTTASASALTAPSTPFLVPASLFLDRTTTAAGHGHGHSQPALDLGARSFLPRALAIALGGPAALPAALRHLHIAPESSLGLAMRETAALCTAATANSTAAACVTSMEDLADHIARTHYRGCGRKPEPGPGPGVWAPPPELLDSPGLLATDDDADGTSSSSSSGSWFRVTRVVPKAGDGDGDRGATYLSCHTVVWPSMAALCHQVADTRVFQVTLEEEEDPEEESTAARTAGRGRRRRAVVTNTALCHRDTSRWSPDHAAFRALGTKPGEGEACHWSAPDEFVYVMQCDPGPGL